MTTTFMEDAVLDAIENHVLRSRTSPQQLEDGKLLIEPEKSKVERNADLRRARLEGGATTDRVGIGNGVSVDAAIQRAWDVYREPGARSDLVEESSSSLVHRRGADKVLDYAGEICVDVRNPVDIAADLELADGDAEEILESSKPLAEYERNPVFIGVYDQDKELAYAVADDALSAAYKGLDERTVTDIQKELDKPTPLF